MVKQDDGGVYEEIYTAPYSGVIEDEEGRWFKISGPSGDTGYVWTDNDGVLGFLLLDPASNEQQVQVTKRTEFAAQGLDASQAFDALKAEYGIENEETGNLLELSQRYQDEYNELNGTTTVKEEALTAAAPTEDDLKETASFGLTLDEDDITVLELVKTDETGVYVRENETWVQLDPEADEDANPTVYGAIWYDVTVDAIPVFDDGAESSLTREDFAQFIVE